MAKAKQAKTSEAKPEVKQNPNDIAAKLADMLSKSAKEQRGDANVDLGVPSKKVAGGKATWKGVMELPNGAGGVLARFAVKTFTAIDDEKFERHMYHSAECRNKLKQGSMACTGCGAEVSKSDAVKGVVLDGEVVLISDEELATLVPQNEKTMRITEYVASYEIDPIYIESTELLSPEEDKSKAAQLTFAALSAMLRRGGLAAKGVRVKRGKEQYFVVRPYGNNGLTVNLIRAEYEVRDTSNLWQPVEVPEELTAMMLTVGENSKKAFTPAKRDQFQANANRFAASKKAGKVPECPVREPEQTGTDDLLAALKATLEKGKGAAAGK